MLPEPIAVTLLVTGALESMGVPPYFIGGSLTMRDAPPMSHHHGLQHNMDLRITEHCDLIDFHVVKFALDDEPAASDALPHYARLVGFYGRDPMVRAFPAANKAWQAGRVAINASSGFKGVPEAVWNFHIGGYQVCHKWLKDRKGRTLSDEDMLHYAKIVTALHETMRIMEEIDAVIEEHGGWPGAFAGTES